METKILAVALIAIIALAFVYHFLFAQSPSNVHTTYEQFISDLEAATKVFVVMDLRNASESSRLAIMQCGVDLAGSIALAPKNVSVFVYEGDKCMDKEGNYTISYCDELLRSGVVFHVKEGISGVFYRNKMVIGIREYTTPCMVTAKKVHTKNNT